VIRPSNEQAVAPFKPQPNKQVIDFTTEPEKAETFQEPEATHTLFDMMQEIK